jgi:ankyrin repeat protein
MSSPGPYSTKATLELGFCYAEGFGTDVDYAKAVSLISKAAHEGLWQARAILGRAAAALNIRLEPEIQSNVYNWLLETSQMGSISAKQDLMVLPYGHEQCGKRKDTGVRKSTQSAAPATTSGNVNEGLIEAAKSGSVEMAELFIQQDADVHHSDQAGCTALHYATLTSTSLALRLLSLGANVLLRSNSVMPLSDEHFLGNEIPADTSPLILSVMANNIIVFEEFLVAAMKEMEPVNAKTMITEILVAGVKLQSVDCIRSVCMRYPMNDASQFDKDGYTPLSYAVRPRMIHHIIHYQPERRHGDSNQTARNDIPVLARQVNVVCTLLEVGSTLQMEEDVSTNCLHLAAAESDTVILSSLLDYCTKLPSNLLEQPSHDEYDGLTPLGVAIRFGRLDAVHVLLDRGANPKKAWPSIRGHALHCCAMFPSEDAVDIAAEILRRDKKSLNRKDIDGRTPLHCAAFREHSEMVQFLIKEGASLLVGDERSYTPLGAAVAARSIRSIQAICEALKKDRLPFYSLSFPVGGRFIPQIMSYSPMDHLLHPGTVSPAREPEMRIESGSRDWGCCDYPFSKPSQNVLKLLLEYYEHNIKLGTNFLEMICFPIWSYSGIHPAICMGNIEAVEIILASKKFVQDFRVLAIYAHHQLLVGRSHIASEDTRLKMVDLLQRHQKDDYLSLRKKRCVSWSRWIWLAYYTLYGDMEQKQFERALAWLGENRRYEYRPPLLEYLPWVPTRYSFLLVLFTLSWLFQAPAIVCLSLVLPDPAINFDKHDIIIAGLMLFMVSVPGAAENVADSRSR